MGDFAKRQPRPFKRKISRTSRTKIALVPKSRQPPAVASVAGSHPGSSPLRGASLVPCSASLTALLARLTRCVSTYQFYVMTMSVGNQSICRKSGKQIGTGPSGYGAYGNRGNPRKTCGFPPFPQAQKTLAAGKFKEAERATPSKLFPKEKRTGLL